MAPVTPGKRVTRAGIAGNRGPPPYLVLEVAVWAAREGHFVAGRADALAIREGRIEVAIDWKSDINPTANVRAAYGRQLLDYLGATGAERGAIVFLTLWRDGLD